MKASTIKEFASAKDFVNIASAIRVNTNNYPFVTFIDSKNVAENVYFSKKASELVAEGQAITADFLKGFQIGYTKNEAGEERVKLISNSERLVLADLLG